MRRYGIVALGLVLGLGTAGGCKIAVDADGLVLCGTTVCGADGQCCIEACGGQPTEDLCIVPPDACGEIWSPVCGCDGQTYASPCEASANCTGVAHDGECVPSPPAECATILCLAGTCCLDTCGGADPNPVDTCIEPPQACIQIYDPVCGCDGMTYSSTCHAHAACVAVDHEGECVP